MFNWVKYLLPSATPKAQGQIRSAELVKAISLVAFLTTLLINLPALAYLPTSIPAIVTTLVLSWLYLSTFYLARRGRVWAASLSLIIALWLVATIIMLGGNAAFMGGVNALGLGGYIVVIIIASLLFGNRAGIAVSGVSLLVCLLLVGFQFLGAKSGGALSMLPHWMPTSPAFALTSQIGLFVTIALLLQFSFRTLQDALDQARRSERAAKRRAVQLQVAAEIARDATAIASNTTAVRQVDQLLNRAVELICQRFEFYHAAIFLVDENREYVVLKATTSEAGQKMLAAGYRLKIGSGGIVGYVAAQEKPRVAPDVGRDSRHLANPLLPQTRSEMALPLQVNKRVTGVLDVQSLQEKAFDDEVITILQVLADLLAVAIETTHLYEAAQRQLRELTVLHAVAIASAEASDENSLIERATQVIGDTFYPHNFGILILDENTNLMVKHSSYHEKVGDEKDQPISKDQGICGAVARSGQTRRVSDVTQDRDYLNVDPQTLSELCVPLKANERILGVINAESTQVNFFSEADERLLNTLAGQLATGIQKARLHSETQQRAQELTQALARLQELDRLKSEFMQNVSHELRTPLAVVVGYAELFENGDLGELNEEQSSSISIIARRLHLLNKLLDDILTIVEIEAHNQNRRPVDLVQIICKSQEEIQQQAAESGLQIEIQMPSETLVVNGIQKHLERACQNLLGNAIKFTPVGGKVSINLFQEDDHAILEVNDSGIGIAPDQIERIFDRFYQVDGSTTRRYGGTGLGLALVKEVIEDHDGQISVQSQINQGSKFRVSLPIGLVSP